MNRAHGKEELAARMERQCRAVCAFLSSDAGIAWQHREHAFSSREMRGCALSQLITQPFLNSRHAQRASRRGDQKVRV